jgi:hypothetical protein
MALRKTGGMMSLMRVAGRVLPAAVVATAGIAALLAAGPAMADQIANKTAVFAALDKVTARISKLEVELDKTVNFGTLKVTPRACFTRSPTEPPKTTAFVEVQDVKLDGSVASIFAGWMFAQSPGLHAVEHPVFDVWLTDCGKAVETASAEGDLAEGEQPAKPVRKRRARRQ